MSASPLPTNSAKRPLEDASSPSRATDQPEAKRPALDKVIKNDEDAEPFPEAKESTDDVKEEEVKDKTNGVKADPDTAPIDGPADAKAAAATVASTSASAMNSVSAHDETSWIHVRAVISSPEAATIIGKGGENVASIRTLSNAKCTVSEYQKGAVERILTVSGIVDAVAKVNIQAFGGPLLTA